MAKIKFSLTGARLSSVQGAKVVNHPQGPNGQCNEGKDGTLYYVVDRRYTTASGGFAKYSTNVYAVNGVFPLDASDCNQICSDTNPLGLRGSIIEGEMKRFEGLPAYQVPDSRTGELVTYTHATLAVFEGQSEDEVRNAFVKRQTLINGANNPVITNNTVTKQEELEALDKAWNLATTPQKKDAIEAKRAVLRAELGITPPITEDAK